MIRRRDLFALAAGAAIAAESSARSAQPGETYRLGILTDTRNAGMAALLDALRRLDYVEGRNLAVDWRLSNGDAQLWPRLAAELTAIGVDAVVVQTTPAALAAKQATSKIPIVITSAIDPVGAGLAESLARPGGNVTGLANLSPELNAKALSLLKEAAPKLQHMAVVWNAANPAFAAVMDNVENAARALGLAAVLQPIRRSEDVPAAFAALKSKAPDGLLVLIDRLVNEHLEEIVGFAVRERLAAASTRRQFAVLGGLLSYGPDILAMDRRAATYLDRIFRGASPADLPFEQPTEFQLVVNLKAAKALGLAVPQSLLSRADELIG